MKNDGKIVRLNLFAINSTIYPIQKNGPHCRADDSVAHYFSSLLWCVYAYHVHRISYCRFSVRINMRPNNIFHAYFTCQSTYFHKRSPIDFGNLYWRLYPNELRNTIGSIQSPRLLPHVYAGTDILLVGTALSCGVIATRFITKAPFIIPIATAADLADL